MLSRCCIQYASKFGKLSSSHRTGKGVFISILKKGNAKECSNYHTIALISHAIKVMLKILHLGINSMWTENFQMFNLDLEKAEPPEIKLPKSVDSLKKQESSRKTSTSASLTMLKPLTVWITTNCAKFFKRWEYQTTLPASWEICMQIKKQQIEPDTEQWTGSKLGKECIKTVYCHLTYLTSMQFTSCEMTGWMNCNLELQFPWEIPTSPDM